MDYTEAQLRQLLLSSHRDVTGTAILCAVGNRNYVNIRMDDGSRLVLRDELSAKRLLQHIFGWIPQADWFPARRDSAAPPR